MNMMFNKANKRPSENETTTTYVSVKEVLQMKRKKNECDFEKLHSPNKFMVGNVEMCFDYEITMYVARGELEKYNLSSSTVNIHYVCFFGHGAAHIKGLAIDIIDGSFYEVYISCGDADTWPSCTFRPVSLNAVLDFAEKNNKPLYEAVKNCNGDTKKLVDFRMYTDFTDKFYYIEMMCEKHVVLCSIGLHNNKFLAVGWLGKLINTDLFISYAECSYDAYQQLRTLYPLLYDRTNALQNNKNLFSYYDEFVGKRRKNSQIVDIIEKNTNPGKYNASFYHTTNPGCKIAEYNCTAPAWMEEFVTYFKNYFVPKK